MSYVLLNETYPLKKSIQVFNQFFLSFCITGRSKTTFILEQSEGRPEFRSRLDACSITRTINVIIFQTASNKFLELKVD